MDLTPVRNILYDILTAEHDDKGNNGEVTAAQSMGVNLTNAVKKDGVNIIQLQSVVNVKVIKKVTDALRFLDDAQKQIEKECVIEAEVEKEEVKALPSPQPDFLIEMLDKRATLKDFVEVAERKYIAEAVTRFGDTEAMRLLNIRKTRVEKALEYAEKEEKNEKYHALTVP